MNARRAIVRVSAAALAVGLAGVAVSAPQHKSRRPPPPSTTHEAEPETTATIVTRPPPARPAEPALNPDDEPLPAPFRLPTATRARVRDCGLKWQSMKMSGEARDDIWRDFATQCYAAANGPVLKR